MHTQCILWIVFMIFPNENFFHAPQVELIFKCYSESRSTISIIIILQYRMWRALFDFWASHLDHYCGTKQCLTKFLLSQNCHYFFIMILDPQIILKLRIIKPKCTYFIRREFCQTSKTGFETGIRAQHVDWKWRVCARALGRTPEIYTRRQSNLRNATYYNVYYMRCYYY